MSKKNNNNDNHSTITLTDPDTGAILSIPDNMVTDHEYDSSNDYITITSDDNTTISLDNLISNDYINYNDIRSIYERPNNTTIRKRYVGHKHFDDLGDIGVHTLEQMSKRGNQ